MLNVTLKYMMWSDLSCCGRTHDGFSITPVSSNNSSCVHTRFLVVTSSVFLFFFSFLCGPFIGLYVLSSVLWFPHKKNVQFVFTSSCRRVNVIYTLFVPKSYCVVSLIWFSLSCVPYVASISGLSFLHCLFGIL